MKAAMNFISTKYFKKMLLFSYSAVHYFFCQNQPSYPLTHPLFISVYLV